jgi:hypothetical protein
MVPVVPGGLDEEASDVAVAGLGDGSLSSCLTRAVLTGDEADKGHESASCGEAFEVVEFHGEADGGDRLEAAEAAESRDGLGVARIDSETLDVDE